MGEGSLMAAVFRENANGTYDLEVDGRTRDYDLDDDEFGDALRRVRYTGPDVYLEDLTGARERILRR